MVAPNFIYDIKKVPSYLLGLAETRARADGQVLRIEQAMAELQTELAKARETRASCDALIERYNSTLAAATIAPIKAWKGRYGERGALLDEIKRVVREAYPGSVTSLNIADHLIRHFQLGFDATASDIPASILVLVAHSAGQQSSQPVGLRLGVWWTGRRPPSSGAAGAQPQV